MSEHVHMLSDEHEEAARWINAIERGLTELEQEQFSAWIADNPARAEIMAQQAAILSAVQEAPELKVTPDWGDAKMVAPLHASPDGSPGWVQRGLLAASALAACLVIGFGVSTLIEPQTGPLAAPVLYMASDRAIQSETLSDGSRLWLDARTDVQLAYNEAERRVVLESGGVFAEVAHNPDRPFTVASGPVTVTAVGTAFEVQNRDGAFRIAVSEGVVRVEDGASAPILLEAGQSLVRQAQEGWGEPQSTAHVAGWRDGRLWVDSQSLGALVDRLNLYRDTPILIDGADVSAIAVSGVFVTRRDEAETMAQALADSVDGCAAPQPSGAIVITRNSMLCP